MVNNVYNCMSVHAMVASLLSQFQVSKIRVVFKNPHSNCKRTEVNRIMNRKPGFYVCAAAVPRFRNNETESSVR